jgi:hypothetical protein
LVFGFSPSERPDGRAGKNQSLVAVIPGQKAPRTLLGQNSFWIIAKNHFEMSIFLVCYKGNVSLADNNIPTESEKTCF